MSIINNLELNSFSKQFSKKYILSLLTNSLKVAWYPVMNFLSVAILSSLNAFELNMNTNIIFLFVQGLLNLVIVQPLISTNNEYNIDWENISLIRYILGILLIICNTQYAAFFSLIILIDVYSKISLKFNLWIYLPGIFFLLGLFLINRFHNHDYWFLFSFFFFIGKSKTTYMAKCIKANFMNSFSVFFQWFYSVGYLLLLTIIFSSESFNEVREIQVFFGLSTMVVALLEFNALKNKIHKTTALKYFVPIVIAVVSLCFGSSAILVIAFCISSIIYMMSMEKVISIKTTGNFWAINKSHKFAFSFQTLSLLILFYLKDYHLTNYLLPSIIFILIVGPNLIFYLLTKNLCKFY